MFTRERVLFAAFMLLVLGVAPFLVNQKRGGMADVAMTAYVLDSMPLKYKDIDYVTIRSSGLICYQLGELSDCFNPLVKSPQYSLALDAVSGVRIYRKSFWGIYYYGGLLVDVPTEKRKEYSKEDVKDGLSYVISVLKEELNEKEKITESWGDAK